MDHVMKYGILIFATPIYWYSMTGTMKTFIDRCSQTLREAKYYNFREKMALKKAFVIAVGGDSPTIKGLPFIQQLHYIFNFVHLPFEAYIIANANKPDEIMNDHHPVLKADELNVKLKNLENERL